MAQTVRGVAQQRTSPGESKDSSFWQGLIDYWYGDAEGQGGQPAQEGGIVDPMVKSVAPQAPMPQGFSPGGLAAASQQYADQFQQGIPQNRAYVPPPGQYPVPPGQAGAAAPGQPPQIQPQSAGNIPVTPRQLQEAFQAASQYLPPETLDQIRTLYADNPDQMMEALRQSVPAQAQPPGPQTPAMQTGNQAQPPPQPPPQPNLNQQPAPQPQTPPQPNMGRQGPISYQAPSTGSSIARPDAGQVYPPARLPTPEEFQVIAQRSGLYNTPDAMRAISELYVANPQPTLDALMQGIDPLAQQLQTPEPASLMDRPLQGLPLQQTPDQLALSHSGPGRGYGMEPQPPPRPRLGQPAGNMAQQGPPTYPPPVLDDDIVRLESVRDPASVTPPREPAIRRPPTARQIRGRMGEPLSESTAAARETRPYAPGDTTIRRPPNRKERRENQRRQERKEQREAEARRHAETNIKPEPPPQPRPKQESPNIYRPKTKEEQMDEEGVVRLQSVRRFKKPQPRMAERGGATGLSTEAGPRG